MKLLSYLACFVVCPVVVRASVTFSDEPEDTVKTSPFVAESVGKGEETATPQEQEAAARKCEAHRKKKHKKASKKKTKSRKSSSFTDKFQIEKTDRIALTPKLTGTIKPELWDLLTVKDGLTTYMQWEPGVLYAAAKVPKGKDLVVSLDLTGKGWLAGKENIELRFSWDGQVPRVTFRRLDLSNPNEPRWLEDSIMAKSVYALGSEGEKTWDVEFKLLGVGLSPMTIGKNIGLRFDAVKKGHETPVGYIPRALTTVRLVMNRSTELPEGLKWDATFKKARNVAFGEPISVRLDFQHLKGAKTADFRKVSLRSQGVDDEIITSITQPFPGFNRKGRAYLNYLATMPYQSTAGYRVLRANLESPEGKTTTLEASYHVCDPILFDVNLPTNLVSKNEGQILRGSVTLRSQSMYKLNGVFTLEVPEGWTVTKGKNKKFAIFSNGIAHIKLELIVPKGAKGLIPLTYKADLGERVVQQTILYPILDSEAS
jgi:hypothetical protein